MFKQIVGFPKYSINENGEIYTSYNKNGKTRLKPFVDDDGYQRVHLYGQDGTRVWIGVHKLVAMMFVDGYAQGLVVNHKDHNRQNNNAENLEWVTPEKNAQYSLARIREGNKRLWKRVVRIDANGNRTAYPSLSCASRENQLSAANLRRCLKGGTPKCGGYFWEYEIEAF